jgi:hypothetical protein
MYLQVLDKNTVKLVAGEFDLLVVDKEEAGVTAGAVKQRDFLELEDLDDAVSYHLLHDMLSLCYNVFCCKVLWLVLLVCVTADAVKQRDFAELEDLDDAVRC